ncbi:hypothetical protein WJX79_006073 [Trebouxia sp. C0005]
MPQPVRVFQRQISKLDVKSLDSSVDKASEPKAQPKEPSTSDIFHAVDAKLASDSTETDIAEPLDTNEVFRQAELAKEAARQAAVDAEQLLISRQAEPVADVVYFNDAKAMAEIGCPAINLTEVTNNFTCFYQNPSAEAVEFLPSTWEADTVTGCAAIFRPLPADFGRPWCLQKSEEVDTRVGSYLEQTSNKKALHLQRSTLLLGMLSGPNPTHQLNIHFYHIYVWMKTHGIEMGELNIVADCPNPSKCMGPYGIGLARAFGSDLMNLVFLPISGSIVEIFPVAQGRQVFTPELWNLAHMVGKNHLKYVSPYNSTLMLDEGGKVVGDRPVHQTKATEVHVPGLVALIEAAALSAVLENTVWNRMSIEPRASGKGIKCWDRTRQ